MVYITNGINAMFRLRRERRREKNREKVKGGTHFDQHNNDIFPYN